MKEGRNPVVAVLVQGLGPLVFLAALGLYLWQLCPGVFWLDSSEFIAASRGAYPPHPPGTPAYVVLAHLASLVPLGSVAIRINILSALLGAAGIRVLFAGLKQLLARKDCTGLGAQAFAALLVLGLAMSRAAWFQSIRAEVYTLNSLIIASAIYLGLSWDAGRDREPRPGLFPVALILGIGLANHHYLVLLLFPALLFWGLSTTSARAWFTPGRILGLAGFGLAGMLLYSFLPLRSLSGTQLNWGDASSFQGFLDMVSAKTFQIAMTELPKAPFGEACSTIVQSWISLLGWPLFLTGFLGLIAWCLLEARTGVFLALVVFAGIFSKALMYLDVENPDDHGYFMTGLQGLTLAATGLVPAARALIQRLPRASERILTPVSALVLVLIAGAAPLVTGRTMARDVKTFGLRHFTAPDHINQAFIEELPPSTLFLPAYYATFFNHVYYRTVEARRPDVTMVHVSFMERIEGGAPYCKVMAAREPELRPILEEFQETRTLPLGKLLELSKSRPVIFENDAVALSPELDPAGTISLGYQGLQLPWDHTMFIGPGLSLVTPPLKLSSGASFEVQTRFWTGFYKPLTGRDIHPELKKLLLYIHFRNAIYFAQRSMWLEAGVETRLARSLDPDAARVQEMSNLIQSHLNP